MIQFFDAVFSRSFLGRLHHFAGGCELVETLIKLSSALVDPGSDGNAETPCGTEEVLR